MNESRTEKIIESVKNMIKDKISSLEDNCKSLYSLELDDLCKIKIHKENESVATRNMLILYKKIDTKLKNSYLKSIENYKQMLGISLDVLARILLKIDQNEKNLGIEDYFSFMTSIKLSIISIPNFAELISQFLIDQTEDINQIISDTKNNKKGQYYQEELNEEKTISEHEEQNGEKTLSEYEKQYDIIKEDNQKDYEESKQPEIFKEYQSVGLKNLGNSCYISSILQALAHCSLWYHDLDYSNSSLTMILNKLLAIMKSPKADNENCLEYLRMFRNELSFSNQDFEIGYQNDPKYLLIHLSKLLPTNGEFFFKWARFISFTHKYKNTIHETIYPEYTFTVITILPKKSCVEESDFRIGFQDIVCQLPEKRVKGYCTECNKEEMGKEQVSSIRRAQYAVFAISNGTCSFKPMKIIEFSFYEYKLELEAVIMRLGKNNNSGHNYAMGYEDGKWIIYNDELVYEALDDSFNGGYMFFYKVTS